MIFRDPGTDSDIISAQHFWMGGLETAGPGCYDAVAIARAAGFRMLVMSRIGHATIGLRPSERTRIATTGPASETLHRIRHAAIVP